MVHVPIAFFKLSVSIHQGKTITPKMNKILNMKRENTGGGNGSIDLYYETLV